MQIKFCGGCGKTKPASEFHKRTKSKDGLQPQCKACTRAHQLDWLEAHPEKVDEYREASNERMKKKYAEDSAHREGIKKRTKEWRAKLSPEERRTLYRRGYLWSMYRLREAGYQALLKRFKKRCGCCGKKRKLVVDHDHDTGKVRGLLCRTCNNALGSLGDNEEGLQKAIAYLRMPRD